MRLKSNKKVYIHCIKTMYKDELENTEGTTILNDNDVEMIEDHVIPCCPENVYTLGQGQVYTPGQGNSILDTFLTKQIQQIEYKKKQQLVTSPASIKSTFTMASVKSTIKGGAIKCKDISRQSLLKLRTNPVVVGRAKAVKTDEGIKPENNVFEVEKDRSKPIHAFNDIMMISNTLNPRDMVDPIILKSEPFQDDQSSFNSALQKLVKAINTGSIRSMNELVSAVTNSDTFAFNEPIVETFQELILINHEDDTFYPALKIKDACEKRIEQWYEECDRIIDIEDTGIKVPQNIKEGELNTLLYKYIDCKHKSLFVDKYFPEAIEQITKNAKLHLMEREMQLSSDLDNTAVKKCNKTPTLEELKINVPEKLVFYETYVYKTNNTRIPCSKYKKTKNNPSENICKYLSGNHLPEFVELQKRNQYSVPPPEPSAQWVSCTEFQTSIEKESDIVPYNFYNSKGFVSGFELCYQEFPAENTFSKRTKNSKKLIMVLFNHRFLQTIVVSEPDLESLEAVFEHPEYGFTELFTIDTNNEEIQETVCKQFNKISFNDINEVNESLNAVAKLIELIESKNAVSEPLMEEETSIKKYFNDFFEISNDVNHKMKASSLYDIVMRAEPKCKIDKSRLSGFRNRLSTYLKDIGLQKKRYNDGFYYYGILEKKIDRAYFNALTRTYLAEKDVDEYKNKRSELTDEIKINKEFFISSSLFFSPSQ